MPYNPGIDYIGGQLFAQGIGNFGRSIGQGIEEWDKLKRDEAQSQAIYGYAKAHNLITPEQELKWAQGSARDRVGLADGWSKTITLDQADKHFQAEQQFKYDQLKNAIQVANIHAAAAAGPQMSEADVLQARDYAARHGYLAFPTGDRRGVVYQPDPAFKGQTYAGLGQPGDPYKDPETGKVIGRIGPDYKLELFRQDDPLKAAAAKAMAAGEENLGGGGGGGFNPFAWGSRMLGGILGGVGGGGGGEPAAPAAPAPPAQGGGQVPGIGTTRTVNGVTYKWDGTGWIPQ